MDKKVFLQPDFRAKNWQLIETKVFPQETVSLDGFVQISIPISEEVSPILVSPKQAWLQNVHKSCVWQQVCGFCCYNTSCLMGGRQKWASDRSCLHSVQANIHTDSTCGIQRLTMPPPPSYIAILLFGTF